METTTIISKAEYAARCGWSRAYLSKLLREGKVTSTADGRINVKQADKQLAGCRGTTMHGKHGRSRCDDDGDALDLSTLTEEEGKQLLLEAWDQFFRISELVWKLSSPKRLTKQIMLGIIQGLR